MHTCEGGEGEPFSPALSSSPLLSCACAYEGEEKEISLLLPLSFSSTRIRASVRDRGRCLLPFSALSLLASPHDGYWFCREARSEENSFFLSNSLSPLLCICAHVRDDYNFLILSSPSFLFLFYPHHLHHPLPPCLSHSALPSTFSYGAPLTAEMKFREV